MLLLPFGNGDGSSTFNLPDLRGRVITGRDNMGGVAANRLPPPYNSLGGTGGVDSNTLITANLPPFIPSGTITITDPGHSHVISPTAATITSSGQPGSQPNAYASIGASSTNTAYTGITAVFNGYNQGGTSEPITNIQPTQSYNYIIKVIPDSNPNSFFGVASIGGMYGMIECGFGLTCAGNTISSINSLVPPPTLTTLGGIFQSNAPANQFAIGVDLAGNLLYGGGSTTVNGEVCALGASCTITAAAGSIAVGTTTVIGGSNNGVIYKDSSGLVATSNSVSNGLVTTDAGGVPVISNSNIVTNSLLTQSPAATFKGNPTSSLTNAQDFTIQGLTNLISPDPINDYLPIYDHSTGTLKNVTPQGLAGSITAGVSAINGQTGAFTCGKGIDCTSNNLNVSNIVSPSKFGAIGDGVTDNCIAFTNLNNFISTLPAQNINVIMDNGNYLINCDITLLGTYHFIKGTMLKPGNTYTITFANMPLAPATKIFDLYNAANGVDYGGKIALPFYYGVTPIWVDWFGAIGDDTTLYNNIAFQKAIDTLYPVPGANGGLINVSSGSYLMCGQLNISNVVSIVGFNTIGTQLKAEPSCWGSDINMIKYFNPTGTGSVFSCWIKNLTIDANKVDAISAVMDIGAWQENSGAEGVTIRQFNRTAIYDYGFYGGAATLNFKDMQIFYASDTPYQPIGFDLQSPALANWTNVNIIGLTFTGDDSSIHPSSVGVFASGRINLNVSGIHFEDTVTGFSLNAFATLQGSGINSGHDSVDIIKIQGFTNTATGEANIAGSSTATSRVSVQGIFLGEAVNILNDSVNTITISDQFGLPFSYPSQSQYNGLTPTCGTGCTNVIGTNQRFSATTGSGVTTVGVFFNPPFVSTPSSCVATTTFNSNVYISGLSTTSVVFSLSSAATNQNIFVSCQQ